MCYNLEIIRHRHLSIPAPDYKFGVEVDVRDYNETLVISHDIPNEKSLSFEKFLKNVNPNILLAINIKSSEIQQKLQNLLMKYKIENYFTFDWSMPELLKAIKNNLNCAFRVSEYEKNIIPQCKWAWVDSFHSIWYNEEYLTSLKNMGLKVALVSPELHNRTNELERIRMIVDKINVDAVCTDLPEFWLR
jgi:hypothetical protein